jgi:hypothetical protein
MYHVFIHSLFVYTLFVHHPYLYSFSYIIEILIPEILFFLNQLQDEANGEIHGEKRKSGKRQARNRVFDSNGVT